MNKIEALILGIVQGLTEYLPVSSSGHLVLVESLFGKNTGEENLIFVVVVHAGTALSSVVVFRKVILDLFKGLFRFKWNESTQYTSKLLLSAIPVGIVGVFFKDYVDALFKGNVLIVGVCLIVTAILLFLTHVAKSGEKKIGYGHAFIIGVAQAIAVLPGISRSGATISTSLLLGTDKERAAQFSFLMVILPIFGETLLDVKKILFPDPGAEDMLGSLNWQVLLIGFVAAFLVGWVACKFMLKLVKQGRLYYFSIYCLIVGIVAILASFGVFHHV